MSLGGFGWKNGIKVFQAFGIFDRFIAHSLINNTWKYQLPASFLAERFGELSNKDKIKMLKVMRKASAKMIKEKINTLSIKEIKLLITPLTNKKK
jgi:hypothetical protein